MSEPARRNYEYRIYPTRWQQAELDRQLGLCADLYNAALEQRRRMWRDYGTSIGYRQQSAQLTDARREHPWLRGMNALAQHEVLQRLDRAFDAFYRRLAAGERPGYPQDPRALAQDSSGSQDRAIPPVTLTSASGPLAQDSSGSQERAVMTWATEANGPDLAQDSSGSPLSPQERGMGQRVCERSCVGSAAPDLSHDRGASGCASASGVSAG